MTSGPLAQYLSTAGALLLFTLLNPDAGAALGPALAVPTIAATAAAALAGTAASMAAAVAASGSVPVGARPADSGVRVGSESHGRGADGAPAVATGGLARTRRLAGCVRRRLAGAAGGLSRVTSPVADWLQRILIPSALLSLAGGAWRALLGPSAAAAEAAAELLAVGLGYSALARQGQLGRLPPGWVREQAWRRRHKAAAQRLARYLGDLPPTPPLAPMLAALGRCSIAAGLAVDGVPLCGAADCAAAAAAATAAGPDDSGAGGAGGAGFGGCSGGGPKLLLSFSYRCQNGRARLRTEQAASEAPAPASGGEPAAGDRAAALATQEPAEAAAAAMAAAAAAPASAAALRGLPRAASASSLGAATAAASGVTTAASPAAAAAAPRRATAAQYALDAMRAGQGPPPAAAPPPQVRCAGLGGLAADDGSSEPSAPAASSGATTDTNAGGLHTSSNAPGGPPPQQRPVGPAPAPPSTAAGPNCSGSGAGGSSRGSNSHGAIAGAGPAAAPTALDWQSVLGASPAQAAQLVLQEQAEVEALGLPLYGRADHAHAAARPTGPSERLGLAARAAYLLAVFLPFLTLGIALLLLAAVLGQPDHGHTQAHAHAVPPQHSPADAAESSFGHQQQGEQQRRRSWRCGAAGRCRRAAWALLLGGCRRSGAAFIKWGQWAATRVDLFPDDFCEALSTLHDRAPTHSFAFTRRQVERSFGAPLERMFEAFDPRPVASGSIAQVHRALMRCPDGTPLDVAVKVVHPRVELRIRQDFALLLPAASALGRLPSLRGLSLPETLSQFSASMTAQADLRVEAAHLRRFCANFVRVSGQVTTPRPLPGLVRREVLVESWEAGRSVAAFIRSPGGPLNTAIVCLGVDTYLKMLLQDNFVHTDLHPGNIMVRLVDRSGTPVPFPQGPSAPHQHARHTIAGAAAGVGGSSSSGSSSRGSVGVRRGGGGAFGSAGGTGEPAAPSSDPHLAAASSCSVQLVLLDFGLAEELTPPVRHHFISFLHHLMRGDGASAAAHLLRWTSRRQACPDPAAFTADMVSLAAARCRVDSAPGIDLDAVMKDVLRLARRHRVTIDSCYASLVIAVCVIVGFAASLDPRVNLVDAAVPAMLAHALTGRVVGRLYS